MILSMSYCVTKRTVFSSVAKKTLSTNSRSFLQTGAIFQTASTVKGLACSLVQNSWLSRVSLTYVWTSSLMDYSLQRYVNGASTHLRNIALGEVKDDPGTLRLLAEYLEKYRPQVEPL